MLQAIAAKVTPDLANSLSADVKALHQALSAGAGSPAETARHLA